MGSRMTSFLRQVEHQQALFQQQLDLMKAERDEMKAERDASRQEREAWQQMASILSNVTATALAPTTDYNVVSFLTANPGSDTKAKHDAVSPPKKGIP